MGEKNLNYTTCDIEAKVAQTLIIGSYKVEKVAKSRWKHIQAIKHFFGLNVLLVYQQQFAQVFKSCLNVTMFYIFVFMMVDHKALNSSHIAYYCSFMWCHVITLHAIHAKLHEHDTLMYRWIVNERDILLSTS